MDQFRFFQIGTNSRINTLLNNLRIHLNAAQSSFKFNYYDDDLAEPIKFKNATQVQSEYLERFIESKVKKLKIIGQYPIVLCNYKLEDDLFTVYAPDYAIISTYYWESFDTPALRDHIIISIVDMLVNLYPFELVNHDPHVGCPSDYGAYGNLSEALAKCSYCEECSRSLTNAVRDGKLPSRDKASLLKILDLLAKRKKCFVLMPFSSKFKDIYESTIKVSFSAGGWECMRADEVLETSEVRSIIEEYIHRADLVIADLTGKNANVFYEVGFAHANNKSTVLITQSMDSIPFNLRNHQCFEYSTHNEGLAELSKKLTAIANR